MSDTVRRCPVGGCESLILPARTVCHECLMALPAVDRAALNRTGSVRLDPESYHVAVAAAVQYLNGLGLYRRRSA